MRSQALKFRRDVRRLAARFIAQKMSHAEFVAAVRASAMTAGFVGARRRTRDERTLNALAWGRGSVEPGRLPTLLEPFFERFESGEITKDHLAVEVRRLLDQIEPPGRARRS